jgi:hypothetical protein
LYRKTGRKKKKKREGKTHLLLTSTLTGSLKLALCNFATFVVIVAEKR